MNNQLIIGIVGSNRISGEPSVSGQWAVWACRHSVQTMSKFVKRCKAAGYPAFCADGKFGVLASSIE